MENSRKKINNAYRYARTNNINHAIPETWDENYKRRMKELSGIVEEDLKKLRNNI